MLIGSQSINLILLKNEWQVFSRQADAKIARLKDVIERVQRGEDVDVEKELGTGDEVAEREWADGRIKAAGSQSVLDLGCTNQQLSSCQRIGERRPIVGEERQKKSQEGSKKSGAKSTGKRRQERAQTAEDTRIVCLCR